MQDALRESEQRLKDIIDFLPDATFAIDREGKVILWNRAIEEMTGVRAENMLGRGNYEYALPFYGIRRPILIDLVFISDTDIENKYRFVRKERDIILAEADMMVMEKRLTLWIKARPLYNTGGDIVGAIESIRDITELRQAEKDIKESRRQLADIIDFLPDAMFVVDKDGKVIAWNKAAEEMTGVRAADMLGKSRYEYALCFYGERRPILIDLVLKPDSEIEAKYVRMERRNRALVGESYMSKIKGGRAYVFGMASALRDTKGNIVGAIESVRDITERQRAEESLRCAEEKYRSIFKNAVMGIFQSIPEGRFISANPAFARILGYDSPEELLASITDIAAQVYADPENRNEMLRIIEEKGIVREFEIQALRKDGSTSYFTINARSVRDDNGNLLYYEGTAQDVTKRKLLEARLLQSQKMEAIGTLAGGMAHDFNNILSAIIGYSEMTRGKLQQMELHRYMENILLAGHRAKELVAQILTFSRHTDKELKPVNIRDLLSEALKLLRATIPSTIGIHPEIDPGVMNVLADPTQLHQVLINLCTNAAHAMRESGGLLEVRLDSVKIDQNTPYIN